MARPIGSRIWPDAAVERHRHLLQVEGRSHSAAARIITKEFHWVGREMTRNASIGLATRNGYSNGRQPSKPSGKKRRRRKPMPQPKPKALPISSEPLNIPLTALSEHTCKYPTYSHGRQHLFCGHAVSAPGSSWCHAHERLVWNAPSNRDPASEAKRQAAVRRAFAKKAREAA